MRWVYFARVVGTDGPIKIGCSSGPEGRCRQLGFDLATKIELLAEAPGDLHLERNLHLKFAPHRASAPTRNGWEKAIPGATEWFAPVHEILELIAVARETGKIDLPMEECRERAIAARYKGGETLEQIGSSYGITRERVRQILHSLGIPRRSAAERAYVQMLARRERMRAWEEAYAARRAAA
jgi:hypothetical protein